MSATIIEQATPRLHRSELAVPGSNPAFFERAARSGADCIFLDCEDSVAPDDKTKARQNIVEALNDIDWGDKTLLVRINGLDTQYMYRDVVEIVESCPRLNMLSTYTTACLWKESSPFVVWDEWNESQHGCWRSGSGIR